MIQNLNLRNTRVLVIDDNNHMRRILRTLLLSLGSRSVIEAEDGATGLDIFRAQSPDLIITDLAMPILNGLELVRMIRKPENGVGAFVPIIMISDVSEMHRIVSARDAGVNEFIKKPISASQLSERIYLSLVEPRPFIKTKNYFGPCRRRKEKGRNEGERRGSGECEIIEIEPQLQIAI